MLIIVPNTSRAIEEEEGYGLIDEVVELITKYATKEQERKLLEAEATIEAAKPKVTWKEIALVSAIGFGGLLAMTLVGGRKGAQ